MRKRESQYLGKVADIGCIICYKNGYPGTPAEIHHIRGLALGMWVRNSHDNVIPLCPEHHRGSTGYHGLGRKAFERKYGVTEQELQQLVEGLLNEEAHEDAS